MMGEGTEKQTDKLSKTDISVTGIVVKAYGVY